MKTIMKYKMNKKQTQIYHGMVIIYIILLIISVSAFFYGYHKMDMGHNLIYLDKSFPLYTFTDNGQTGIELYKEGIIDMFLTFFLVIICSFILGALYQYKLNPNERGKHKHGKTN